MQSELTAKLNGCQKPFKSWCNHVAVVASSCRSVSCGSAHLTLSSVTPQSPQSSSTIALLKGYAKVQIRARATATFPIGIRTHFELLTRFWFVFYFLLMRRNPKILRTKMLTILSKFELGLWPNPLMRMVLHRLRVACVHVIFHFPHVTQLPSVRTWKSHWQTSAD